MKALNTQIHDTLVSQHNKGYTSCEHLYTICAHTPSSSHDATLIYAITYAVCANKVCHKLWKASLTYASEWTLRCFLLEPCVCEFKILISLYIFPSILFLFHYIYIYLYLEIYVPPYSCSDTTYILSLNLEIYVPPDSCSETT